MSTHIQIYTDGASRGNPGRGGYGIVLMYKEHKKEKSAGYRKTTNNRMELMAVIIGLSSVTQPAIPVSIYTDSKYVSDAINKGWLSKWQANNYRKVKNPDLWQQLVPLLQKLNVTFHWVKGHADNKYNNRCDQLATQAADQGPYLIDEYYETTVID